jgi:hypothetical protein
LQAFQASQVFQGLLIEGYKPRWPCAKEVYGPGFTPLGTVKFLAKDLAC